MVYRRGPRRLPQEIRRDSISGPVDLIGQRGGIAECPPVVIAHGRSRDQKHNHNRQREPLTQDPRRRMLFPKRPDQQRRRNRESEQEAFERAAVGENRDAECEDESGAHADAAHETWHGAQDQRAAGGRYRATPIAVHPIAEDAQPEERQHGPKERPSGGKPALKHPADSGAHGAPAETDPKPGIPEQHGAGSQDQTLRGRVHGHVGRLKLFMEGLEVDPHGWGGVGQAVGSEGFPGEQEAEFIVDGRLRDGRNRQDSQADQRSGDADQENGQRRLSREAPQPPFQRSEESPAGPGQRERQQQTQYRDGYIDDEQRDAIDGHVRVHESGPIRFGRGCGCNRPAKCQGTANARLRGFDAFVRRPAPRQPVNGSRRGGYSQLAEYASHFIMIESAETSPAHNPRSRYGVCWAFSGR